MTGQDEFLDLIRRVRSGDEDAATALVAQFEPFILRVARFRMRHRGDYDRLRYDVGSIDVCQSVFKSLFARLKAGRFDLNQPKDMEKLLVAMIRFKIANKARKLSVVWREIRCDSEPTERVDPRPGPEKSVNDKDLSEIIFKLFSVERSGDPQPKARRPIVARDRRGARGYWRGPAKQLERAFERVREDPGMRSVLQP